MKPMNQTARSAAIGRFLIIYGLSLLAVGILAWFLFHIPVGVFKATILGFKTEQDEQRQLGKKIDGITANLQRIAQTDQAYLSSTNDIEKGNLQAGLEEYQKNINDALVTVKNDSSGLNSTIAKKSSYNYIIAYNSILAYRNTLTSLQKSLAEKGGEAAELLKIRTQLEACNSQLELYKALASRPVNPPPANPPAGGGGGGNKANEEKLQKQLEECQINLAACIKTKGNVVVPPPSANLSETAKATLLFESGQDLITTAGKTKNLLEKRGILSAAKVILEKSQGAYPDPDKLKKTIMQIDAELKRLSNIG